MGYGKRLVAHRADRDAAVAVAVALQHLAVRSGGLLYGVRFVSCYLAVGAQQLLQRAARTSEPGGLRARRFRGAAYRHGGFHLLFREAREEGPRGHRSLRPELQFGFDDHGGSCAPRGPREYRRQKPILAEWEKEGDFRAVPRWEWSVRRF